MNKSSIKLNESGIKKLKGKRILSSVVAIAIGLTSLVGCGSKGNNSVENSDNTTSLVVDDIEQTNSTTVTTIAEEKTTTTTAEVPTLENIEITSKQEDYFTINNWTTFLSQMWHAVGNKINNPDVKKFESTLITLNLHYLEENNTYYADKYEIDSILDQYYDYSFGSNEYVELENMNDIFSQIRENNTNYEKNTYFDSRRLLLSYQANKADTAVLDALHEYTMELYTLKRDNIAVTDEKIATYTNYLEMMKKFVSGEGKIEGYAQLELSDGACKIAEELMQEYSVLAVNILSTEVRESLDKRLNSSNFYTNMRKDIETHLYHVRREIGEEEIKNRYEQKKKMINSMRDSAYNSVKKMNVTEAEANALFDLANIDYYVSNYDDRAFYDEVISAYDVDYVDVMYEGAQKAVEKIEAYNSKVSKQEELYTYEEFFIDNTVDRASLYNLSVFSYMMTHGESDVKYILEAYTLYSSTLGKLVLSLDEKDSSIVYSIDKNALSYGARQIANWMMKYSFTNAKSVLKDDVIVDSVVNFADIDSRRTYEALVIKVDGYCVNRNSVVYNYYSK